MLVMGYPDGCYQVTVLNVYCWPGAAIQLAAVNARKPIGAAGDGEKMSFHR
jgi:hypothetical protein